MDVIYTVAIKRCARFGLRDPPPQNIDQGPCMPLGSSQECTVPFLLHPFPRLVFNQLPHSTSALVCFFLWHLHSVHDIRSEIN